MSRLIHRVAKLEDKLRPTRMVFLPLKFDPFAPYDADAWARRHEEPEDPGAMFPRLTFDAPHQREELEHGR